VRVQNFLVRKQRDNEEGYPTSRAAMGGGVSVFVLVRGDRLIIGVIY
jgi:hypothetical protein